jgi:N-acyl-D-aspartate/D-glutamate deacylase
VHDLVIRGGLVVDGTGAPARRADVAVDGERIVAVGEVAGAGRTEVDADGLHVMPGFVDIHTHYDGQATWDPELAPSSVHGVTTVLMGNCGVGFAPAAPDRHDWLIGLLEGVEDIPGTALHEGLRWDWESFPDYLDALERRPRALDVGALVAHNPLRAYVMGDRGADPLEAPDEGELARMHVLVREALAAGAMGFSTSRTRFHRTRDGHVLGTKEAAEVELVALVEALREAGTGTVQLISDLYQDHDPDVTAAELRLVTAVARAAGRPLSMTVQQPLSLPDRWRQILDHCSAAWADGVDLKGQVAPRPIGVLLGLESTLNPFMLCRSYGEVARLPLAERLVALQDPDRRSRILAEHREIGAGIGAEIAQSYHLMFRMGDPVDYEPDPSTSIGAEAAQRNVDPAELLYEVLQEDAGRRLLYLPLFNYAHGNLDDTGEMLRHPRTVLGLSDAGAHCGFISDGSQPTTLVQLWGRDRADGLGLEQSVHLMTQSTAWHVGWRDRGVLAPGYLADLNLVELPALGAAPPHLVRDLPAGGRRLVQEAHGYRRTVKRGVTTFVDGHPTGDLPGRLLRGETPAPS